MLVDLGSCYWLAIVVKDRISGATQQVFLLHLDSAELGVAVQGNPLSTVIALICVHKANGGGWGI